MRRSFAPVIIIAASVTLAAGPSAAVDYTVTCTAILSGGPVAEPTPVDVEQTLSLVANAPATAAPNSEVTVTIPAGTNDLPATAEGQTITQYSNLSTSYKVSGGTIVDGSVTGGATHSGDTITLATAGPVPPGSLPTPEVTFRVLAGAAGTNIVVTGGQVLVTAHLGGALTGASAATTCNVPASPPLATTSVVAPGAPVANDDTATTPQDNPVTINVLANDVANTERAIDVSTLRITVPTQSGALADPISGQIRYTPPIGFNGTDTFTYEVCSVAGASGTPGPCDSAVVTVTVQAPVAAAATPTTAAPAAGQLPRTGETSGGLIAAGAFTMLAGVGIVLALRRKLERNWLVD